MNQPFRWGHININVANLDLSIRFYERLGFEVFMPGIPYLGLEAGETRAVPEDAAAALALAHGTQGRACIMQLGRSFPKLDLTELSVAEKRRPLQNQDRGIVRLCLVSEDLQADYQHLLSQQVEFLSPPSQCPDRMAEVAICKDPDGALIELLQVNLERWPKRRRNEQQQ